MLGFFILRIKTLLRSNIVALIIKAVRLKGRKFLLSVDFSIRQGT